MQDTYILGMFVLSSVFSSLAAIGFQNFPFLFVKKHVNRILAIILLATVFLRFGTFSYTTYRSNLDKKFNRPFVEQLMKEEAYLIHGNYWQTWPAVFVANQILFEQNSQNKVYGISYRSSPIKNEILSTLTLTPKIIHLKKQASGTQAKIYGKQLATIKETEKYDVYKLIEK